MLKRLFKRGRPEDDQSDDLPASLEAAIKGMSVIPRDDERTVLAFAGETTNSWYHSETETRKRILAAWPSLNGAQLDRTCRAVKGLIRQATRANSATRERGLWKAWKPLRD